MRSPIILAVLATSLSVVAQGALTYSVTAISAPPGAALLGPAGALPNGQLVGTSSPLVFNPGGGIPNVGFFPLGFTPTGLTSTGQVTGQASLEIYQGYPGTSYFQNYFYNGTGWYGLSDPYIAGSTTAVGMDTAGDLTGTVLAVDGTTHTLVWNNNGSWVDLNSLNAGYFNITAAAMSLNGLVTGQADGKAFSYNNTTLSMLPTLSGGSASGNAINASGQVAGQATVTGGAEHAFLTPSLNKITDLGTLGGVQSDALGVNSLGTVVGWSDTASGTKHGFIYSGGIMTDLNSLVGINPDWTILTAISINDAGMILASATQAGVGVVQTVVIQAVTPEPGTWLLFASALVLFAGYRNRKRLPYLALLLVCALSLTACKKTPEQKTAIALKRGTDYRAQKKYAEAILEFRIALKSTPRSAEAYYQAGLTFLDMLDVPAAYMNLKKALEIDPKHLGAQSRLAELFSASHDPERLKEAAALAEGVLKTSPNDISALNTLAITKYQLGDPADAQRALSDALAAGQSDERTVVNLALMRRYKGDNDGALEVIRDGAAKNPKSSGLALVLARMYAAKNDMVSAEREFKRSTVVDPKCAMCFATLASFYAGTKRPADAEKAYRSAASSGDPKYRYVLGMYYWATGQKPTAVAEFRRLSEADPKDREARQRFVAALRQSGQEKEADAVLQDAFKKNPKDKDALVEHAQSLARAGKLDEAANALRQVIADSRDSFEARYMLSKIYAAKRQFRLQQQELDDALQVNPNFLAARLDLSQSSLAGGKVDAAMDVLERAPPVQKTSVPWLIARNWVLLTKGDLKAAKVSIDQTVAKGGSPEAYLQRGYLEIREKHLPAARADLERVLSAEPGNVRALDALGSSYLADGSTPAAVKAAVDAVAAQAAKSPKLLPVQFAYSLWLSRAGRLEESKNVLRQAQQFAPDDYAIPIRLGELTLASKDPEGARKILEPIVAKNPAISRAQMLLGHVESMTGHPDAALVHYRAVSDLEPDNYEAFNNVAAILTSRKDSVDEALRYAQKARELASNDPNVADTLGWVLYQKGLYSAAVPQLEAARTSPNPVALYHLAMAYARVGDLQKAEQQYTLAYKAAPQMPEAREVESILKRQ